MPPNCSVPNDPPQESPDGNTKAFRRAVPFWASRVRADPALMCCQLPTLCCLNVTARSGTILRPSPSQDPGHVDYWCTTYQGLMYYRRVMGDFEVVVKFPETTQRCLINQAGLMVRESRKCVDEMRGRVYRFNYTTRLEHIFLWIRFGSRPSVATSSSKPTILWMVKPIRILVEVFSSSKIR
jgi:hypothetical protein